MPDVLPLTGDIDPTDVVATLDRTAWDIFEKKQISAYFTQKAETTPETAEASLKMAKIFEQAANLPMVYGLHMPSEEELKSALAAQRAQIRFARNKEKVKIDTFIGTKAQAFVETDRARWLRMAKTMPRLVRHIKETMPK